MGKYFGVSQPYVSDWENGYRTPSLATLNRLAELAKPGEAAVIIGIIEKAYLRGRPGVEIAIPLHNLSIRQKSDCELSEIRRFSDTGNLLDNQDEATKGPQFKLSTRIGRFVDNQLDNLKEPLA